MKEEKEVSGTLTKILFVNPHGSLTLTVKNPDGTTTDWVFTTGSATTLAQTGNQQNRTECAPRRGRHYREVHPGAERQSVGVSQVDYRGRREGDFDLRRQPQ